MQPCHQAVDAIVGGSQVRDNGHNALLPPRDQLAAETYQELSFTLEL